MNLHLGQAQVDNEAHRCSVSYAALIAGVVRLSYAVLLLGLLSGLSRLAGLGLVN